MPKCRKFRVVADDLASALKSPGIPQIGESNARGVVEKVDAIQNGKCWMLSVFFAPAPEVIAEVAAPQPEISLPVAEVIEPAEPESLIEAEPVAEEPKKLGFIDRILSTFTRSTE